MAKVTLDRYVGCLLGGAIGDALGAPVEFMSLQAIRSKYGKNGVKDFVEFPGNYGEFTDDTQMALFTAEGLLRSEHLAMLKGVRGALNTIVYHSYLRWLHTQNFELPGEDKNQVTYDTGQGWLIKQKGLYSRRSPGNTCLQSLRSGKAGTIDHPINESKGCGTVMRVAPVGLMYWHDNEQAFNVACNLSAITHGHPTGYLSGGVLASMISDLAIGFDLRGAIDNAIMVLKKWDNHSETFKAVEKALELYENTKSPKNKVEPETIGKLGQGWVAEEALSISIYSSLLFQDNFEKGVLFSVNHSGDSDSTGSITGNILGLINGKKRIPSRWIEKLRHSNIVVQVAEDVYIGVKGNSYYPNDEWWEKYPGI